MSDVRTKTDWPSIIILFVAGVVASMQMGRTIAIPGQLMDALGLSLTALGWAFSMITAAAAAGGLIAGAALQRFGIRRTIIVGLVWIGIAAALGSVAPTGGWMLAARALEGVGYLAVVVAAPTLMPLLAAPARRAAVMAVWAIFVPVGILLASVLGGALAADLGWRGWFQINAMIVLVMAVWVAWWPPLTAASAVGASHRPRPSFSLRSLAPAFAVRPLALTLGFMAAVVVGLSANALMPAFLAERFGFADERIGGLMAALPIGSMLGSVLLGAWVATARSLWPVSVLAGITALACLTLFVVEAGPTMAIVSGMGVMAGHGALVAVGFALIPQVAHTPSQLAAINGSIVQFGSLGNFLGPPLTGAIGDAAGWPAVGVCLAMVTLGVVVGFGLVRSNRRPESAGMV